MIAFLTPVEFWFGEPPMLRLKPSSDTRAMSRRMSRTATLDGSAVVVDGGYSDADREFVVTMEQLTRETANQIADIAEMGPCHFALEHGLYQGYVKSHSFNTPQNATLNFLVTSKIA
jgi:hypothetical protein